MPKYPAESDDADSIEESLHRRGYKHLRARKRGDAVIVESGPSSDPVKHFRLRRETVHLWLLDIADHRGAWERTPFRETRNQLVDRVVDSFPWALQPIADYPDRTSDHDD